MLTRLFLQKSISNSSLLLSKSAFASLGLNGYCTRYTKSHEWVTCEGKKGRLGITDFAQRTLGDIVFVELPQLKSSRNGDAICVIESVKAAADVYAPFDMKVTAVNNDVGDEPEVINEEPMESWICEFEMDRADDIKNLLTKDQYDKYCQEQ